MSYSPRASSSSSSALAQTAIDLSMGDVESAVGGETHVLVVMQGMVCTARLSGTLVFVSGLIIPAFKALPQNSSRAQCLGQFHENFKKMKKQKHTKHESVPDWYHERL